MAARSLPQSQSRGGEVDGTWTGSQWRCTRFDGGCCASQPREPQHPWVLFPRSRRIRAWQRQSRARWLNGSAERRGESLANSGATRMTSGVRCKETSVASSPAPGDSERPARISIPRYTDWRRGWQWTREPVSGETRARGRGGWRAGPGSRRPNAVGLCGLNEIVGRIGGRSAHEAFYSFLFYSLFSFLYLQVQFEFKIVPNLFSIIL
jgi:hypothetical protein